MSHLSFAVVDTFDIEFSDVTSDFKVSKHRDLDLSEPILLRIDRLDLDARDSRNEATILVEELGPVDCPVADEFHLTHLFIPHHLTTSMKRISGTFSSIRFFSLVVATAPARIVAQ
jgi:hypothetical protein